MILPTLHEYAIAKGVATRQPRVMIPKLHLRMYNAITLWAAGLLPNKAQNLAICIPPRHSKTTTARDAVEWLIGIYPDSNWIYTSYGAELAMTQTVQIRDTIMSDWYQKIFPTRLKRDHKRQDSIATTMGGTIYASGMTGSLTGFGAGIKREEFGGAIIIDDPLSADEARSPTKRAHVCEWYTQTLKSRRNHDKTPMLLIAQRLHTEDLVGHLTTTEPEKWHILKISAMDETTGEMLWPDTFSKESAEKLREVDPSTFYAQYQQEPVIPGGSMIKTDWWEWYNPKEYKIDGFVFATADTAYKAKSTADASVIRVWSAKRRSLDCIDCAYGRWEFPELLAQSRKIYEKYKELGLRYFFIEDKASGTPLEQTLRSQGVPAVGWRPQDYEFPDDKVSRVQEAAWIINARYVRLPEGEEHSRMLVQEASAFMPDMSHAHDDHVDSMTMAVAVWRSLGGGRQK